MIESMLDQASSYAGHIDNLILLIGVLVGFWFLVAEAVLIGLVIKFRAKDGQRAQYITGEEKHEKRWVTIPHLLVLVCDVFIVAGAIWVWVHVKQDLPDPDETVRIVAQQWEWSFHHAGPDGTLGTDDDIITTDELHVQVDRTYHFKLESDDVIHSFSVPVFRLKQDAIPGREITGWFKPTRTGEYDIQCAEMCGVGHGLMGARIFIESPEQHAAWLAEAAPTRFAARLPN